MRVVRVIMHVLVLVSLGNHVTSEQQTCTKTSACACQFPDGSGVDLSQLDSNDPQNPQFPDVSPDIGSDQFSWNPCTAFNEGNGCSDVALCDVHQNDKDVTYFPIGTQDTADFSYNSKGQLQITYIYAGTGGAQRQSFISLTCDSTQSALFSATGENPSGSGMYYFDLTSTIACYPMGTSSKSSLSVGSILCIAFVSIIVVYFIGGVVFQLAVKKERGSNLIIHKDVLIAIPGLIKDGTMFIVRRGGTTSEQKKLLR
ncbi:Cation-dependent mannose-6-phosphate receptor [Mizuhopecten yessoensis]|uniref:Cation-dependent mannose-6-phosphate receptor n=1 Tax=Mizuhopecten yessoensis TaxID=6573 RepID=A0A210PNX0_MIZYE|nr:Cation-dependent mannose-6-phosphate receptor [Mizuhopecten yessoensis]